MVYDDGVQLHKEHKYDYKWNIDNKKGVVTWLDKVVVAWLDINGDNFMWISDTALMIVLNIFSSRTPWNRFLREPWMENL